MRLEDVKTFKQLSWSSRNLYRKSFCFFELTAVHLQKKKLRCTAFFRWSSSPSSGAFEIFFIYFSFQFVQISKTSSCSMFTSVFVTNPLCTSPFTQAVFCSKHLAYYQLTASHFLAIFSPFLFLTAEFIWANSSAEKISFQHRAWCIKLTITSKNKLF